MTTMVTITDQGLKRHRALDQHVDRFREMLGHLGAKELEQFKALLEQSPPSRHVSIGRAPIA